MKFSIKDGENDEDDEFDVDDEDDDLLEKVAKVMKPAIQEHLGTQASLLKFVMSISVIFQQGYEPDIKTDPPACF